MISWTGLVFFFAVVSFIATESDEDFKLPSYIDVCYRDDPKLKDCLKTNIQKLVPKFKTGAKEFDLAPLDPMEFKDLVFDYKNPIVGGHLEFSKVSISNLTKIRVLNIKPKMNVPNKFILDFDGSFPEINVKGNYDLSGNVLTIPVKMKGLVDLMFEKVILSYKVIGDVKTIGEYDYLMLKKFNLRVKTKDITHAYVRNDNVVEGRPALNKAVITALNSNWQVVADSFLPVLFPVTDQLMKDFFSKFFRKYPYDVIFPKRTRSTD